MTDNDIVLAELKLLRDQGHKSENIGKILNLKNTAEKDYLTPDEEERLRELLKRQTS